jgi:hypothetical protein
MNAVPAYVSIVFILTTIAAVATLVLAVRPAALKTAPGKLLLIILPLWIVVQTVLAISGFYQAIGSLPPRVLVFAVLPTVFLMALYFAFFRRFIDGLRLRYLTAIHIVRIPVEVVLYWLSIAGAVPAIMTFVGWNYDILSGIGAIAVLVLGFRRGNANRWVVAAFNLLGLVLLVNIVTIAVLSLQTPMQRFGFEQPNIAVLYFPYILLPAVIVPIVLFAHLAALYKSLRGSVT